MSAISSSTTRRQIDEARSASFNAARRAVERLQDARRHNAEAEAESQAACSSTEARIAKEHRNHAAWAASSADIAATAARQEAMTARQWAQMLSDIAVNDADAARDEEIAWTNARSAMEHAAQAEIAAVQAERHLESARQAVVALENDTARLRTEADAATEQAIRSGHGERAAHEALIAAALSDTARDGDLLAAACEYRRVVEQHRRDIEAEQAAWDRLSTAEAQQQAATSWR